MIIELFDALDAILTALFVWIVIIAAVAAPVVVGVAAFLKWAVKRAWRALGGPCGASDGPDASADPRDSPDPAGGRTADPGYEEAA